MKRLKKILKISSYLLFVVFLIIYVLFWYFTAPKSDQDVIKSYAADGVSIQLKYNHFREFRYRKIEFVKDTSLPYFVFVHGTIGSVLDFKSYFVDKDLSNRVNMIAYDRVGYNYKDEHPVQESIAFERDMLEAILKDVPESKRIVIGYSYGGPIALASRLKSKRTILIAPALYSKIEPMPFLLYMYKFKLTRWLVPPIWKEASKEKLSHTADLKKYENQWASHPNKVLSIHGDSDWIVPYENSVILKKDFPASRFELVTLQNANHDLIWSRFDAIKRILLNQLP